MFQGVDGLLHFTWSDRMRNSVVDDIILFPEEAEFIKVETGKEGDRVYVLQYHHSSRKFMFWFQDKGHAEEDDERCEKVNKLMNNPEEIQATLRELNAPQTTPTPIAEGDGTAEGRLQMGSLDDILNNLGFPESVAPPTSTNEEEKGDTTTTTTSEEEEKGDTTNTNTASGESNEEANDSMQEEKEEGGGLTLDMFDQAFQV